MAMSDLDTLTPSMVLRERALRAARRLLAAEGLGVSMDAIAETAGVGRRSLFRHFDSRDALIAEALAAAIDSYGARLRDDLAVDGPLEPWLLMVATHVNRAHIDAGRGLWQLAAAADDELSPELVAVNRRRRAQRRRWTQQTSERAWRLAGGTGTVPDSVVDAFGLTLSSFATHSMINDLRRDLDRHTTNSATLLAHVIRSELALERD
jgi:AcrR family transcriptional regulator